MTACPVAELAHRQARNIGDYERLEVERGYDHPWMKNAFEKISATEDEALTVQATSLEGAMFQIMLAFSDIDTLTAVGERLPDGRVNWEAVRTIEALHDKIKRYLYSAMTAIEAGSGTQREQLGGDYYMGRELDPRTPKPADAAGGVS